MVAGVSVLVLAMAFACFLWWDGHRFRDNLVSERRSTAELIASNSLAALTFGDEKASREVLSSLQFVGDVQGAALFDKSGKRLAVFARTMAQRKALTVAPKVGSTVQLGDRIQISHPIRLDGEVIGGLVLVVNLEALRERQQAYIEIAFMLSLGALLVAGFLGSTTQGSVTKPILRLASMMRSVSRNRDYGQRMAHDSHDEVGALVEGFNAMLSEIQFRDAALQIANDELEERVAQRTALLEAEVTEREARELELQENRRFLTDFIETAPIGIVRLDRDHRVCSANRAALAIYGATEVDFIGRTIEEFHPDSAFRQRLVKSEGDTVWSYEGIIRTASGEERFVEMTASNTGFDENSENVSLFLRDVTIEKRAEAIERAKDRAERASQAKNEFLSRMSHELRTPMNAILGFGQLLEMEPLEEREKECVDQILKGGRHLLNLINEVLNISRIESGRISISLEPVNLGTVLTEAVDLVAPMADQRGITIENSVREGDRVCVRADRQRLSQVLLNLLSNAVKYNSDRGVIYCSATSREDGQIRIEIRDTGKGIPAEHADRIFIPFDRLGAEQSTVEGTGLGLPLSKSLTEAMEGRLYLDLESPHPGSCFVVELPAASDVFEHSAPELKLTQAHFSPMSEQKTVLLIEDNIDNVRLIEQLIASRPGIRLLVAMQGNLGVEFAREHRPNLILLDVNLPDTTGLEVASRLKSDAQLARTPLLIVTADANSSVRQKFQEIGCHGYLEKPLDVRKFLAVVDQLLSDEVKLSA